MNAMRITIIAATCLVLFLSMFVCTSSEIEDVRLKETIQHLSNSVDYDNKATGIINNGGAFSTMSVEDSEKMTEFLKKSLKEASLVDTELLNSKYPNWGNKYRNEYIEGLKLFIKGHENINAQYSIEGQRKMSLYKDWFSKVRKDL